jgi:hypothetical protein
MRFLTRILAREFSPHRSVTLRASLPPSFSSYHAHKVLDLSLLVWKGSGLAERSNHTPLRLDRVKWEIIHQNESEGNLRILEWEVQAFLKQKKTLKLFSIEESPHCFSTEQCMDPWVFRENGSQDQFSETLDSTNLE